MSTGGTFRDFREAAAAVLEHLHHRVGFDLWMVTRVQGDEWIILAAEDHGYGVAEGSVFRWADTFCSQMIAGKGPHIAPRSAACDAYAGAAIGQKLPVGAYIGYPLEREDGSLFGTLCAVHPASQPQQITAEAPLIEMLARLLASILDAELRDVTRLRERERAAAHDQGLEDPATALLDLRGWRRLLETEERVCARYGAAACVAVVRVQQARQVGAWGGPPPTDEIMRRAARVVVETVRDADRLARLGRYDLALLILDCDHANVGELLDRLRTAFGAAKIHVEVAAAHRTPRETLDAAWQRAAQKLDGVGDSGAQV